MQTHGHGELVYFIIKPSNISVLSEASISTRIYALMTVLKGIAEIEILCLNSRENFEDKEDIKRILAVYFEQNVTTERFEDFDGERWVILNE